jgi:hypothetical protein
VRVGAVTAALGSAAAAVGTPDDGGATGFATGTDDDDADATGIADDDADATGIADDDAADAATGIDDDDGTATGIDADDAAEPEEGQPLGPGPCAARTGPLFSGAAIGRAAASWIAAIAPVDDDGGSRTAPLLSVLAVALGRGAAAGAGASGGGNRTGPLVSREGGVASGTAPDRSRGGSGGGSAVAPDRSRGSGGGVLSEARSRGGGGGTPGWVLSRGRSDSLRSGRASAPLAAPSGASVPAGSEGPPVDAATVRARYLRPPHRGKHRGQRLAAMTSAQRACTIGRVDALGDARRSVSRPRVPRGRRRCARARRLPDRRPR